MDAELREAIRRKDVPGVIRAHLRVGILSQAALERSIALACPPATDYAKEADLGDLVYKHPLAALDIHTPTDQSWRTLAPWVGYLPMADAYQWGIDRLFFWGERYREMVGTRPGTRWEESLACMAMIQDYLRLGKPELAYRMSREAWDMVVPSGPRYPDPMAILGPLADSVRDMLVTCDQAKMLDWQATSPHYRATLPSYLHNRVTEAVARTWYCPDEERMRRRAIRAGQRNYIPYQTIADQMERMYNMRWQTPQVANLVRVVGLRSLGWYTLAPETRRVLLGINPRMGECFTSEAYTGQPWRVF